MEQLLERYVHEFIGCTPDGGFSFAQRLKQLVNIILIAMYDMIYHQSANHGPERVRFIKMDHPRPPPLVHDSAL